VLAGDTQRCPAGHERADAAAGSEDRTHGRGGVEEMLEVVEQEQDLSPAEEPGQIVGRADRLRDLGVEQRGIGEADQWHPEDAVALRAYELRRDLEREPGLARAAGAGERHEPFAVREHRDELLDLALPPDERARGERQVRGVERPQRRKVTVAELEQSLRVGEVLQPVLAQVANFGVRLEKVEGRFREDDLAAVRGRRDARGPMDVHADIALLGQERLPGVESHADADRAGLERLPRIFGSRCRISRAGECDEEGVSLRVDLDAVVPREGVSQGLAMLGEQVAVAVAMLPQQPRRALDVGEEEGDGAGGKIAPAHGPIFPRGRLQAARS
jgi:hypothetical protein